MVEIYRDSVSKTVALDVPNAFVTSVKFFRGSKQIDIGTSSSPAEVPYSITHMDGEFYVEWKYVIQYEEYVRKDFHKIVTPLFSAQELKAFNQTFESLSESKIVELERMVRGVVEAITGQSFGYEQGTHETWGGGDTVLMSDKRIISVSSIGFGGYGILPYTYRPIRNGFGLERHGKLWDGNLHNITGPIRDPYALRNTTMFYNNMSYSVTGEFGWTQVPSEIKDAALLIAELFSCREASWRDRYLRAVSAADWRFDFHGSAFSGTGSVTADRLLSKYIVSNMAVI